MMLVTKDVDNLTPDEFHMLEDATMGDYGQMRMELRYYYDDPDMAEADQAKAVMLFRGEELLSWCLLFSGYAYFYTHKQHRNRGYGTTVMREAKKFNPKPNVSPWSDESGGFFSKFDCIPDRYGEDFLTAKPKVC